MPQNIRTIPASGSTDWYGHYGDMDLAARELQAFGARRRLIPSVGDFYTMRGTNTTAPSQVNGQLDLGAHFLPAATYDQVIFNCTNAASSGGVIKAVAYWGTDWQAGTKPGAKAFETATVDATATGTKTLALSTPLVVPNDGLPLWVGLVPQGGASTVPQWTCFDLNGAYATEAVTTQVLFYAYVSTGWRLTGQTGTADTTGSAGTRAPNTMPWLYFRRSA